jgi:hypothetical protein
MKRTLEEELLELVAAATSPDLIDEAEAERHLELNGIGPQDPVILCAYGQTNRFVPERRGDAAYDWEEVTAQAALGARDYKALRRHLTNADAKTPSLGYISCPGGTAIKSRKEIKDGRVLIVEIDKPGLDKDVQAGVWRKANLPEPTYQLDTGGKSIHHVWVLDQMVGADLIREGRARLSQAIEDATGMKTDHAMHSPHQPSRLAGGIHPKTGKRSVLINVTGKRYGLEEVMAACPAKEQTKVVASSDNLFRADDPGDVVRPGEYPKPEELSQPVPITLAMRKESVERINSGQEGDQRPVRAFLLSREAHEAKAQIEALGYAVAASPSVEDLFDTFCRNSNWLGIGRGEQDLEDLRARHCAIPQDVGEGYFSKSALRRRIAKWAEDEGHWHWRPGFGKQHRGDAAEDSRKKPTPLTPSKRYEIFKRYVRWVVRFERNTLRRNVCLRDARRRLELNQLIQPPEVASLVMEAQDHRAGNSYRALSDVDRKAMAKPTVEWVIKDAIPKQDLTAAVGRPKVGKTRKAIASVKSVLTGCAFMGFEPVGTEDTVVILITDDQSAGDTAVMLEAAGLYEHPRLLWSQRFRLTEEQLDQLLSDIKNNPGAFVVIDSLRSITRSSGAKENDAEMGMLVYDLKQSVIDAGGSLMLVHHGNKDDKAVGMEAMSGHNSIAGACNTILSTHYLEDERGFPCKDSPLRRVVREARSGQGADLVVEIKPDGSFERVDSFEGFARSKVAADLQQQELTALQKPPKAVVALIQALVQLFEEDQPHLPTLEVMKLAGLVRQTVQFKTDLNKGEQSSYTTCNEWINKLIKFEMLEIRPDESGQPGASRRRLYKLSQKGREYAHSIHCGVS